MSLSALRKDFSLFCMAENGTQAVIGIADRKGVLVE